MYAIHIHALIFKIQEYTNKCTTLQCKFSTARTLELRVLVCLTQRLYISAWCIGWKVLEYINLH